MRKKTIREALTQQDDVIRDKVSKLLADYGVKTDFLPYIDNVTLLTMFVEMVKPSISEIDNEVSYKKEDKIYEDLIYDTNPITEIRIWRGGNKPYVIKDNKNLLEYIAIALKPNLEKEEYNKQGKELIHSSHYINILKPVFEKIELGTENKKLSFMWHLCDIAGYPFTKQQIQATNTGKAKLIRNWFKRNKKHEKY